MGDISRKTFDPKKHYSGVLQQQGRVQLDADWNEQLAIQQHRTETEAKDAIGLCGVPKKNGGFKVEKTPDGRDLAITPGRIYVDGLLCELEATPIPITFVRDNQPVLNNQAIVPTLIVDNRALQPGQWVEISAANTLAKLLQITVADKNLLTFNTSIAEYRMASAPSLRRVTTYIAQPDYPNPDFTSSLTSPPLSPPTSPPSSPPTSPPSGFTQLSLSDGTYLVYLDAWQREINALDDPHIREVALGGPDTTTRLKTIWQVKLLPVSTAGMSPPSSPPGGAPTCKTTFAEWDSLTAPSTGRLNARTKPPEDTKDPCLLPPSAGYRRLENQLYRVEVQTDGTRDTATFKWSRDNASVETSVEKIDGNTVTVSDIGKDEVLGFAGGQWVEIVDDESELKGTPRPLVQIDSIDPATRKITMKTSVAALQNKPNLKLRRWDQTGPTVKPDGVKMTADFIDLEGGIQVQFSTGRYKPGDYWLIPARTATGEIEWPPFEVPNTRPIPQPPVGIRHHYCRLALLEVKGGALNLTDCRALFPTLTEICAEDVCFDNSVCKLDGAKTVQEAIDRLCQTRDREPGIRIRQVLTVDPNGALVPLLNDTDVPVTRLFGGINVVCDANHVIEPATISRATCYVTVEIPFRPAGITTVAGAYQPLILAGRVGTRGATIIWEPSDEVRRLLDQLPSLTPREDRGILAHLTLKGNFIFTREDPVLFLDGEVFGFRRADAGTIDLQLPSGDGRRGGTFEMWFWLAAPPAPPLLRVTGVRILSTGPDPNNPNPTVLGALTAQGGPGITVPFNESAIPNAIEVQFTVPVDANSVISGQSFIVAINNVPLLGRILFTPDNRTLRWVVEAAPDQGLRPGSYRVTLKGTGRPMITSQGVPLDGEFGLPSGDGVPGGDFVFDLGVG